jgi:hypothetical protein
MDGELGAGHPFRVPPRLRKALRVLVGMASMAAFVLVLLAILVHYAGGWGVPYFSFTSPRGSPCKNTLTGYVCSPLTLADVEHWGDVELPDDTVVETGRYQSTHDYKLDATLRVPTDGAKAAMTALTRAFGRCQSTHASPLTAPVKSPCVLSNDDAITNSRDASSRLYVIGTGLSRDGSRPIALSIKSR